MGGGGWGALRGNRLGSLLSAVLAIAPSEIARVERKADDAPHQKQTRKKKEKPKLCRLLRQLIELGEEVVTVRVPCGYDSGLDLGEGGCLYHSL